MQRPAVLRATEFVCVKNLAQHPELRIIAALSRQHVNDLVARRDHGTTLPEDLRGKRIGVYRGTSSENRSVAERVVRALAVASDLVADSPEETAAYPTSAAFLI